MKNLYNKFNVLTQTIDTNKNINYPTNNIAFVMSDSEFNITWYPQENIGRISHL